METDKLTIQRAIDGDEAAMRALWSRHAPHVDAVVRRLVGNDPDLAADIAQENYRARWNRVFDVGSDSLYCPIPGSARR